MRASTTHMPHYCCICNQDRRGGTQNHIRIGNTETWQCQGCLTIKVKNGKSMVSDVDVARGAIENFPIDVI